MEIERGAYSCRSTRHCYAAHTFIRINNKRVFSRVLMILRPFVRTRCLDQLAHLGIEGFRSCIHARLVGGAVLDQQPGDFELLVPRGPRQRRPIARDAEISVSAMLQEQSGHLNVSVMSSVTERRLIARGPRVHAAPGLLEEQARTCQRAVSSRMIQWCLPMTVAIVHRCTAIKELLYHRGMSLSGCHMKQSAVALGAKRKRLAAAVGQ